MILENYRVFIVNNCSSDGISEDSFDKINYDILTQGQPHGDHKYKNVFSLDSNRTFNS